MTARPNPTWTIDPYSVPNILEPVRKGHVRDMLFRIGGAKSGRRGDSVVAIPYAFVGGAGHLFLPDLASVSSQPHRDWDQENMLDRGSHTWETQHSYGSHSLMSKWASPNHIDIIGELGVVPPGVVVALRVRAVHDDQEYGEPLDDNSRNSSAIEDLVLLLRDELAIVKDAKVEWIWRAMPTFDALIRHGLLEYDKVDAYEMEHGPDWMDHFLADLLERDPDLIPLETESAGTANDYV